MLWKAVTAPKLTSRNQRHAAGAHWHGLQDHLSIIGAATWQGGEFHWFTTELLDRGWLGPKLMRIHWAGWHSQPLYPAWGPAPMSLADYGVSYVVLTGSSWLSGTLDEFIHEFICMNLYQYKFKYEMIIWIHSLYEFINEMITLFHEFMTSCLWFHTCRFWIRIHQIWINEFDFIKNKFNDVNSDWKWSRIYYSVFISLNSVVKCAIWIWCMNS